MAKVHVFALTTVVLLLSILSAATSKRQRNSRFRRFGARVIQEINNRVPYLVYAYDTSDERVLNPFFKAHFSSIINRARTWVKDLKLTSINMRKEEKRAKELGITGDAKLYVFVRGRPSSFREEFDHKRVLRWLKGSLKVGAVELATLRDYKAFIEGDDFTLLLVGGDKVSRDRLRKFKEVAERLPQYDFAIISEEGLRERLNLTTAEGTIFLHRRFSKQLRLFEAELSIDGVEKAIKEERIFSRVYQHSEGFWTRVAIADEPVLALFHDGDDRPSLDAFHASREETRHGILYVALNASRRDVRPMMRAVGVQNSSLPQLRILRNQLGSFFKFRPSEDNVERPGRVTKITIADFFSRFDKGTVPSYMLSEEPYDDEDAPVRRLVAKNFDRVLEGFKNSAVYLLVYFDERRQPAKEMKEVQVFEELVANLTANGSVPPGKIFFGRVNLAHNEVEGLEAGASAAVIRFPSSLEAISKEDEPTGGTKTLDILGSESKAFLVHRLRDFFSKDVEYPSSERPSEKLQKKWDRILKRSAQNVEEFIRSLQAEAEGGEKKRSKKKSKKERAAETKEAKPEATPSADEIVEEETKERKGSSQKIDL
eukprot:TRINITY_DN1010_c0_g1_i1.p1 TRINITY_DN1010_c0_g1~~TRINITY_DN1010_c0_g1_i1.p1  ORF type:complete len:598 (-),score=180.70 TRINITY_DN1010_c0_g1_i1:669-2462(-)